MNVSGNQEVALKQHDIELENSDCFEVHPQSFQGKCCSGTLGS